MQAPWKASILCFKAFYLFLLALVGLFPARARDGEFGMMYMPRPPYNATGGGSGLPSGLSPSQFSQSNQTVDRFNRSQDTYVIAVGAHL